jgi:endonuclease/exonuclease/phosphatase family metal-dependent hydrolase
MKLITWNIQWGRGVDGRVDLARIVDHANALADFDVLCLQEVADNYPSLGGNDDANQFAQLAALLPGYTAIEGIAVDVSGNEGRRRRFGNMIFTRLTVHAIRRHALPWPADAGKESMPRVAIEATLAMPSGPVRVTTSHLEYYSATQRNAQVRRLRELHEEASVRAMRPGFKSIDRGPFTETPQTTNAILTADFNFPPDDPAFDAIQGPYESGTPAFRDAWQLLNGHTPHAPTFCLYDHSWKETPYCCDFIFVSEDLAPRVRGLEVDGDTQLSDHQPVLLELDAR